MSYHNFLLTLSNFFLQWYNSKKFIKRVSQIMCIVIHIYCYFIFLKEDSHYDSLFFFSLSPYVIGGVGNSWCKPVRNSCLTFNSIQSLSNSH